MAWTVPPVMRNAENDSVSSPAGSQVGAKQTALIKATRAALAAVATDVQGGLRETVGVGATLNVDERCSVVIALPVETDTAQRAHLARAIDLENVEAWCDDEHRIHVGVGPWYSTKDVDQVVLSITKVVHVVLGIHASDTAAATQGKRGLLARLVASWTEVAAIQKQSTHDKGSG